MTLLQQFIECMKQGDNLALANLFCEKCIFHDSSLNRIGLDTIHIKGKSAVEMAFHNRFGFNQGPFKITAEKYINETLAWYFVEYKQGVIPVSVFVIIDEKTNKISQLNISAY